MGSADRPTRPWRPSSFRLTGTGVYPDKTTDRSTGRSVACWDVRFVVDGAAVEKRFKGTGGSARAADWAKRLADGFAAGHLYDPHARRFVTPTGAAAIDAVTVFTATETFWHAWLADSRPEGTTKVAMRRNLNRARATLLRTDAPRSTTAEQAAIDAYLTRHSLPVQPVAPDGEAVEATERRLAPLSDAQRAGQAWLAQWSVPLSECDHEQLSALVAQYRKPERPRRGRVGAETSPRTERRMVADLKQWWSWTAARNRGLHNPWPAVAVRSVSKVKTALAVRAVDADLVLSPAEAFALAWAVGVCHPKGTGRRLMAYVLVMAFCGLRPGEAAALVVEDLELRPGRSWIHVGRNRRSLPGWVALEGDDTDFGPLKGRDAGHSRRTPVPAWLVPVLTDHVAAFTDGGDDSLVFTAPEGGLLSPSNLDRDFWRPAVALAFPEPAKRRVRTKASARADKLSRLRRHDGRHAAVSMWLAAGVKPKTAQGWSGHLTLSVFLDVYGHLLPGEDEADAALIDEYLTGRL